LQVQDARHDEKKAAAMKKHVEKMTAFHIHFMEKGLDPVTGAEFQKYCSLPATYELDEVIVAVSVALTDVWTSPVYVFMNCRWHP
jgi:hypothetical protein